MSAPLQVFGGVAIILGLAGTWLAGQRRAGWLVCILSSVLWLPALVTGEQWAAVLNVGLSVAICGRNYLAGDQLVPSGLDAEGRPMDTDLASGEDWPGASRRRSLAHAVRGGGAR